MKSIKYIIFTIVFLFLNIFYVQASCSEDDIDLLKKEVNKIKVTYKHKGVVEDDGTVFYNRFDITLKNVNDDFYITHSGYEELIPNEGIASTELENGDYTFEVNSKKCGIVVDEIFVKIPRFNIYSLDPLCEGIDGESFPLCGKYYEYQVDYDNFYARVNHYRVTHNIGDDSPSVTDEKSNMFDLISDFLLQYYIYIIVVLVIIILLIVIILLIIKRRKRRIILK